MRSGNAQNLKGVDNTAQIKWVKLTTDMFDNRKIKQIRHLPEGNNIVLIWVMLLTMAGRCNASGMIFLTENIPYTIESLAIELEFDQTVVKLALNVLQKFGMIIYDENSFMICGWEEHQNVEGMEKIREQTRQRVAKYRENQKALMPNVTSNVTVTQSNATDKDIDKDIRNKSKNIYEEFANGDSDLLDALKEYDAYRKLKKKPLTPEAKKRLLKRLTTLSDDPKTWVKMLYRSIDKGWTDVYELTADYKSQRKVTPGMGTVEERQKAHEFKPTEF